MAQVGPPPTLGDVTDTTTPVTGVNCEGAERDFVVDITISGLATFIDTSVTKDTVLAPIDPATYSPQAMSLVLPNVENLRKTKPSLSGLDEHHAVLAFCPELFCGAKVRKPTYYKGAGAPDYLFYDLRGQDITLDPAAIASRNPSPPDYTMKHVGGSTGPTGPGFCPQRMPAPGDETSFYWVSRITESGGAGLKVKPEYLDPKNADDLSARLKISEGTLRSCVRNKTVWEYNTVLPNGTGHEQAIAQEVHYTLKAHGSKFTISLSDFANPAQTDEITLVPDANNRIDLRLVNFPPKSIRPNPHPTTIKAGKDEHFVIYYEALTTPPAQLAIPWPTMNYCANTCTPAFPTCLKDPPPPPPARTESSAQKQASTGARSAFDPETVNCGPDHLP
jgi:hypothetical protein